MPLMFFSTIFVMERCQDTWTLNVGLKIIASVGVSYM